MALSKSRTYPASKFTPEVIAEGIGAFKQLFPKAERRTHQVKVGLETWTFDDDSEFYSDYRKTNTRSARLTYYSLEKHHEFSLHFHQLWGTDVSVSAKSRGDIESVFRAFDANAEACRMPEEDIESTLRERLEIFIGHGRSLQWRDVKEHLHDKHGFKVTAYETEPRAGLHIADILKDMEDKASFALLVMTAEDEDAGGKMHARENVIHEAGLFQGRLGMKRAIVLLEDGCGTFSNLAGVQYIPFSKGNIREAFGDILATIKREFGASRS
ncbi:nucleotide-binding protein [Bradyrhizobium sp. CCBAU 45321]|uniref:nucleotide-binding protein n=1 Tax=Bradyrhizobium sp. CCBAU 45321 TaxID=1641878 RepID=UPI00230361B7|nr:nucleotide-binding protein [Bradyrhizobium sp. CCBAU 45321]